jgi:protocatechuate 3,4-dioxygenase beta subunit
MSSTPTDNTRGRVALIVVLMLCVLVLVAATWLRPVVEHEAPYRAESTQLGSAPAAATTTLAAWSGTPLRGHTPRPQASEKPRGAAVSGTILDLTGGTIAGARVEAMPPAPQNVPGSVVQSDTEGRFELFAAPGTVLLRASAVGYTAAQQTVIAPGVNVQLELVPGARIVGEVRSALDAAPLAGIEVTAMKQLVFVPGDGRAVTDDRGHFTLDGLSAGSFQLTARGSHWFGRADAPIVLAIAQAAGPVQIRAYPALVVQGRVIVGSSREACRGGHVGLSSAPENENEFAALVALDETGLARFEGVPPGDFHVQVACEGSPTRDDYSSVRVVDADLSNLVWAVAAPVRLRGRVVDARGNGMPDRKVVAEATGPLDESEPAQDGEASAGEGISDQLGDFEIASLRAARRYRVQLADDPSISASVALYADGTSDELVLKANASGTLLVHVTRAGTAIREPVVVQVYSALGARTPQPDRAGTFVLRNVAPEQWVVTVRDGRNPSVSRTVDLSAGATLEVTLDLPALSANLTGMVLDALGAPVGDAWVKVFARDALQGLPADSALTAVDGSFALDNLDPSARYDVEVSRADGARTVSNNAQPGQRVVIKFP